MNRIRNSVVAASIAALGMGAGVAQAGSLSGGTTTFANELFGSGFADVAIPAGGSFTTTYTVAASPGEAFNVDLTLDNGATWGSALTSGSLTFTDQGAGSAATTTLVSGGQTDDSTATFRVNVQTALDSGDTFTLSYDIDDSTALSSASSALNMAWSLSDATGKVDTDENIDYADSESGTDESISAGTDSTIDVASNSQQFLNGDFNADGDANTNDGVQLGTFDITDGGAETEDDGSTNWSIGNSDATATGSLTISGNFGASVNVDNDDDANTNDGLYINLDGAACSNGDVGSANTLTADSLDSSSATFDLTNGELQTLQTNSGVVCMAVDTSTAIPETTPSATLDVDWDDGDYRDESVTEDLATLAKNGDTAVLNFLLTPNGAYSNYVRISNASGIAGDVFMTLYNDSGDSAQFNLGDISGISSAELASQGSTKLISINDIYAAAQAANSSFATSGDSNKLRMVVDAETPDITVQSFSLSTDGTTFSIMAEDGSQAD